MENKRGYTLIELVVVMAIFAVLTSLGVGGLVMARNNAQAGAIAEALVTTIREAQNNSISVKNGCGSFSSKLWEVEITNNNFSLYTVCNTANPGAVNTTLVQGNMSPYADGSTIVTKAQDGTEYGITNIFFAAPFGKGYLKTAAPTSTDWEEGRDKLSEEYVPTFTINGNQLIVTIRFSLATRTVVIEPGGDVYEQ